MHWIETEKWREIERECVYVKWHITVPYTIFDWLGYGKMVLVKLKLICIYSLEENRKWCVTYTIISKNQNALHVTTALCWLSTCLRNMCVRVYACKRLDLEFSMWKPFLKLFGGLNANPYHAERKSRKKSNRVILFIPLQCQHSIHFVMAINL